MAKNRKLSFEAEQVSFGGAIQLPLLRGCIPSITFGHMAGDRERGNDQRVRSRLRLSTGAVLDDAKHLASEGDGLLPNFEVSHASCHGPQHGSTNPSLWYQ